MRQHIVRWLREAWSSWPTAGWRDRTEIVLGSLLILVAWFAMLLLAAGVGLAALTYVFVLARLAWQLSGAVL